MANFNYKAGMHSVGQYQMSAIPFVTASVTVAALGSAPTEIVFPRITKFITIRNVIPTSSSDNTTFRVGFSSIGTSGSVPSNHNYFTLANGESYTGDWRVRRVYLLCNTVAQSSASVIAGLTSVSTSSIGFDNWTGSLGVG
jgi:hypothetical protein